jgi:hypothetical protein
MLLSVLTTESALEVVPVRAAVEAADDRRPPDSAIA